MRILHLLSQLEVTGAETYALQLADQQIALGHEVQIVSDRLHFPTKADYTPRPIDDRSWPQRIKNFFWLKKFIREHKIEIIHAHSRAASWVAYYAARSTMLPVISTIHGRQHIHSSSVGKDIYGDKIITVCENLRIHLINELHIEPQKISVIPNGFDFVELDQHLNYLKRDQTTVDSDKNFYLSIIGRTSSLKGERTAMLIEKVVPHLFARYPNLVLEIVGGEIHHLPERAIRKIRELNQKYRGRIICYGFVSDIPRYIQESNLVIAAGRIAIKALHIGTPLIAFGESQYCGLVTNENIKQAMASNFGDSFPHRQLPNYDSAQILSDICQVIDAQSHSAAEENTRLKKISHDTYNLPAVNTQVVAEYRSAMMLKRCPNGLPILMYHKIPNEDLSSPHKIWLRKDKFHEQMQRLKNEGFTTITFTDYLDFREGRKPLHDFPAKPIILTFDDGYFDNLENALPILQKFNFRGVFYCLGNRNIHRNEWDIRQGDKPHELLDDAGIRKLAATGMEIGAHGMDHRDLTTMTVSEARHEMRESKKILENISGQKIISFAYPYGNCSPSLKEQAKQSGFAFAVATDHGAAHPEYDALELFRANIFPQDSERKLLRKASPWYRDYFYSSRKKEQLPSN